MSTTITVNGLYEYSDVGIAGYAYIINNVVYDAGDLHQAEMDNEPFTVEEVLEEFDEVSPFDIDTRGSEILAIQFEYETMLYQKLPNGRFVELLPRKEYEYGEINDIEILQVPLPNGRDFGGFFQRVRLTRLEPNIRNLIFRQQTSNLDEILDFLNPGLMYTYFLW